jgi:2-methylcitrate dehydratase PrpD
MRMLDSPDAPKRAPERAIDAKVSLPFTIATALVRGEVTLDSFAPEALRAPDVLALANLARFTALEDADPGAMASGGITLRLKNGSELRQFVSARCGAPCNPLTHDELEAKFRTCARLAAAPLGETQIEAIVACVARFEEVAEVATLFDDILGRPPIEADLGARARCRGRCPFSAWSCS